MLHVYSVAATIVPWRPTRPVDHGIKAMNGALRDKIWRLAMPVNGEGVNASNWDINCFAL